MRSAGPVGCEDPAAGSGREAGEGWESGKPEPTERAEGREGRKPPVESSAADVLRARRFTWATAELT